jgi:PAS domain S-box-containing protein
MTAELLEADSAAVLLLEEGTLVPQAVWTPGQGHLATVFDLSFAETVAGERRPVTLEGAERSPAGASITGEPAGGLLGTPLLRDGKLIGVLQVASREPRRFADDDVTLLQLLADRVAVAIDHARLYREAQEEIRRREEAENALKMPSLVLEHMVEGVSLADEHGILVYTNPAEDAMFGYERGELLGKHVTVQNDYAPEENERRVREAIDQLKATGVWMGEWRNRRQDGSPFITRARITTLQFAGSQHFVCVQEDITAQKRAQEALRQSEERFRTLAEVLPQLVWVTGPDGGVEYYNRPWYAYTGLTEEQTSGEGWLQVVHPEDRESARECWRATAETGAPYEIEYRLRAADGSYRWFLARALPLRDDRGNTARWFGTCTDIHDQRLAQDQLRESDRQKDEFLAVLAHELRNPLAPIRNAIRVLDHVGSPDPQAARQRAVIERQSQHMARLLDDLLDVSRITRGKIELRKEFVDLGAVLSQVVEAHRGALEQRGHRFAVALPDEPLAVHADPTRLHQIVGNLLTNALKYTDPGGEVSLALAREGEEAVVRVKDSGIGIVPEFLPHVFDLFAQGDRSFAHADAGLGIGLTMVKRLVELHGGRVFARSEGLGRGSEFVVRLPLSAAPAHPATGGEPGGEPGTPRRRVLIVDDNQDAAETLQEVVSLWGHRAFAAHSGCEAVRLAPEVLPEIVILDIGMPDMDGYEVARRLRQYPALRGTVLVALTGYGQAEDRRRAEAAGFDCHLTKPVDLALLSQLLSGAAEAAKG